MDELLMMFNRLMYTLESAPTKQLETARYIITVSVDPNKVKMEDIHSHEVFTMKDFSDREISLLACIAAMEDVI